MAALVHNFIMMISDSRLWLPGNITWSDLEEKGYKVPEVGEVTVSLLLIGSFLYGLQKILSRFFFTRLALMLGVKEPIRKQPPNNFLLEKVYKEKGKSVARNERQVEQLSKQLDWSSAEVKGWFQERALHDKPSDIYRFNQSCWLLYLFVHINALGFYCVWDKPWLLDNTQLWREFPQTVSWEVSMYLKVESGLMFHSLLSVLFGPSREDINLVLVHHVTQLLIFVFCHMLLFQRAFAVMTFLHDLPHLAIELTKLPRILGMHRLNYVLFLVFGVIWFVTRVYLYQFRFLYSLYVDFGHRAYLGLYLFWIVCLIIAMFTTMWSIKLIAVVLAPLSFSKKIKQN